MRKIKVVTLNGISGTIETNVSTLRELKPILRDREINYTGMKLLVGETKNELSEDVAILPVDDFKLYITPARTKSGGIIAELDEKVDDIQNYLEEILEILRELDNNINTGNTTNKANLNSMGPVPTLSYEDQQDLDDIKQFASTSEWD